MSDQYLGEIRIFSFGYPPQGWMPCNGQLLSIQSNQALYSLLGTTFGGNGTSTFGLPNLQGSVALSAGTGSGGIGSYVRGQTGGSASVTLSGSQVPVHNHGANASSTTASVSTPSSNVLPASSSGSLFYTPNNSQPGAMAGNALANNLGGAPHSNIQPSLVVYICIATTGIYPSHN